LNPLGRGGGWRVENFKILENNVISVETQNHQRTTTTTMVLEIHTVQKCTLHTSYSATAGEILKKKFKFETIKPHLVKK